ncbi:MAG: NUDIX domain-containing protein [Nanoarchaeota archaeon]
MVCKVIQLSVTNYIFCGDDILFLKRHPSKRIAPNKLLGVGGKLEPNENFILAAIRETQEETGYIIHPSDIHFSGISNLKTVLGDDKEWLVGIFLIEVKTKTIPVGNHTSDGEFLWINKHSLFKDNYNFIDDFYYYVDSLLNNKLFFMVFDYTESHVFNRII